MVTLMCTLETYLWCDAIHLHRHDDRELGGEVLTVDEDLRGGEAEGPLWAGGELHPSRPCKSVGGEASEPRSDWSFNVDLSAKFYYCD